MKEIYIFDIDGCVTPPIFSNFVKKNGSRKKLVEDVEKNGYKIALFPEFIYFYEKFCTNADMVIFLTGRKESEFGKLTETQLNSLNMIKRFEVIYYPEEKQNIAKEYFDWKVERIYEILNETINHDHAGRDFKTNINIKLYDDLVDYFPDIEKIAKELELKILLFKIEGNESWNSFLL